MPKKQVYFFGAGRAEGNARMKNLLGGKGANLAEMTNLKIPVPAGFTISTEVCDYYDKHRKSYPKTLRAEVDRNLAKIEKGMNARFGDAKNPLLVSVRSGAAVSMPGMMDTVLNLGLNDRTVEGLAKLTGNRRFAYDAYRRFITMFGDVVCGTGKEVFEHELDAAKKRRGVKNDTDLGERDMIELVSTYKRIFRQRAKQEFPTDPQKQLWMSIGAVFGSWNNRRAIDYRRLNRIEGLVGTAVNVQAMVFGNMGADCGTGVAFSRDPATGEKVFYGEYLMNAQGEDVVAGTRTPRPIETLKKVNPKVYKQLVGIKDRLEKHYRDVQDMEFTIQKGKLYFLQTRTGKRTAQAAVKIAVDMVREKRISKKTAVLRVEPAQLNALLHKQIDAASFMAKAIAKGLPASPGAAVGAIVVDAARAAELAKQGPVLLVRPETTPEDLIGMDASQGILTARGGMTSHAAVVARGMGKCCIAGCGAVVVDTEARTVRIPDKDLSFREGDFLTLNGSTGEVFEGKAPLVDPALTGEFAAFMKWADGFRRLGVRTNADTPDDAKRAREFGAEGIGLCRTEHMFFGKERIKAVREMILASDEAGRRRALAKILPYQKQDFVGLFEAMEGLTVTIRLLDPPLHEFLPHDPAIISDLAQTMGVPARVIEEKIESLKEQNPMLGHRGCRLAITYPEIADVQTVAIISAACEVRKKKKKVLPEIMVPLIGTVAELSILRERIQKVAAETMKREGVKVDYRIGTMIEIPRAALLADEVAREADFFSFGTNDLTQMTFGFSRDDAGFLEEYVRKGILENDPFQVLERKGVGMLVEMGVRLGRKTKKNLKIGICGEHGGEPSSIAFVHHAGLDYVSCSPYRVPIARLAAAHAALREES